MLAIRTQGGFCNRLRAIVCASLWAEELEKSFEIYWPEEKGHMACRIEEILDVKSIPRLTNTKAEFLKGSKQILNSSDMKTMIGLCGDDQIRIQSYSIFHDEFAKATPKAVKLLQSIKILPFLESESEADADAESYKIPPKCIGIHIRRTDHTNCIKASPLSAFERKITELLEKDPTLVFFLSTDDMEVKRNFQAMFGPSILSPIQSLGRFTKEQQLYGIIDWLLLQKCSKILASQGSSFSELAAMRAGIPLELI